MYFLMIHVALDIDFSTSHSWFIAVKEIFIKYNLPDPYDLLRDPSEIQLEENCEQAC